MKIGIVGLGYVGLPLAVAFAEAGDEVVGLDTDSRKIEALREYGIDVADREPLEVAPNAVNARYLATKRERLGHLLEGRRPLALAPARGNGKRGGKA